MKRERFLMPEGIYLSGNSLGLMSIDSQQKITQRLGEWQTSAVKGWEDWFTLPERLSAGLAPLVGANPEEIITTATITNNLHSLLATFYRPKGGRKHIVATELDFPTDLYALKSWADREDAELRMVVSRDGYTIVEEDIEALLTDDVALLMVPVALHASCQRLDIAQLAKAAHARGIVIGVDLAHSIGCMPHHLHDWGVDFAVWCTYKYLNAGPGAPGGIFVHEKHFDKTPGLAGWWGNDKANTFEMRPFYRKAQGAAAYQTGTQSPMMLAGLEGSLQIFGELDIQSIRQQSLGLTGYLMQRIDEKLPEITIVTPRDDDRRGGHVAIRHPEAKIISFALRNQHIVPDFRSPDVLRIAPTALYNTMAEMDELVAVLRTMLDTGSHKAFAHTQARVV